MGCNRVNEVRSKGEKKSLEDPAKVMIVSVLRKTLKTLPPLLFSKPHSKEDRKGRKGRVGRKEQGGWVKKTNLIEE